MKGYVAIIQVLNSNAEVTRGSLLKKTNNLMFSSASAELELSYIDNVRKMLLSVGYIERVKRGKYRAITKIPNITYSQLVSNYNESK